MEEYVSTSLEFIYSHNNFGISIKTKYTVFYNKYTGEEYILLIPK